MTMNTAHTQSTTSQAFFEEKYTRAADPWSFATSVYEQARYQAILRVLDGSTAADPACGPLYGHAFEPGCSIGVLTEQLAARCRSVFAADLSPTAVARARARCRDLKNVSIECASFQAASPPEAPDLIVLSEIGYYFTQPELETTARRLIAQLSPGGTLLACHWLGSSADHLLSGDQVHACLATMDGLKHQLGERHQHAAKGAGGFRLDLWVRA